MYFFFRVCSVIYISSNVLYVLLLFCIGVQGVFQVPPMTLLGALHLNHGTDFNSSLTTLKLLLILTNSMLICVVLYCTSDVLYIYTHIQRGWGWVFWFWIGRVWIKVKYKYIFGFVLFITFFCETIFLKGAILLNIQKHIKLRRWKNMKINYLSVRESFFFYDFLIIHFY